MKTLALFITTTTTTRKQTKTPPPTKPNQNQITEYWLNLFTRYNASFMVSLRLRATTELVKSWKYEVKEMIQWIKSLPHKHGVLSSDP